MNAIDAKPETGRADGGSRAGSESRARARADRERDPGSLPLRRRPGDARERLPEAPGRRPVVPARVRRAGAARTLVVPRLPAAIGPALERRKALGVERRKRFGASTRSTQRE